MIVNFHPKVIMSKKGSDIINRLVEEEGQEVFHVSSKTVEEWKDLVKSDEKLILVSPVYWWGPTSIFDKWIEEVLSYGFAYKYNEAGGVDGLLKGREFEMHLTHGTPRIYAEKMRENIKERMELGVFGFCDSKVKVTFYDSEE